MKKIEIRAAANIIGIVNMQTGVLKLKNGKICLCKYTGRSGKTEQIKVYNLYYS